jgi:hypothetical protein
VTVPVTETSNAIDDTSTGKLMEGVLAAFAQFDNDVSSCDFSDGYSSKCRLAKLVQSLI